MSPTSPTAMQRLDQEGRGHLQGKIQRWNEPQIEPARPLPRQAFGQGVADGMGRHEDPLRHRSVTTAQVRELG